LGLILSREVDEMRMVKKLSAAFLGLALVAVGPLVAQAGFMNMNILIAQVGNDVVATATGSFNTATLTPGLQVGFPAGVAEDFLRVGVNNNLDRAWRYRVIWDNLTPFGTSDIQIAPTFSTGDRIGFDLGLRSGLPRIFAPENYVSGSIISGTSVWVNTSLNDLGLIQGNYSYGYRRLATGSALGHVNLSVVIPEPTSLGLWVVGLASSTLLVRRRRG
jgi:hypothetical protein